MTGEQLTLEDLREDLELEAYGRYLNEEDEKYRATLTEKQLRDYRIFNGEIAARCPRCGKRDVDIDHHSEPDMVGETYWTEFKCCGHTDDHGSTALEYRNGKAVDIR